MNNNSNSGIDFFGILQTVFIVLKLTNVINWSWLWVLSPMWISILIVILIFIIFAIFFKLESE